MTNNPEPITDTTAQEITRISWDERVTLVRLQAMMTERGFTPDVAEQRGSFLKCHSKELTAGGRPLCRIHFDATTRYLSIYTRLRKDSQI